MLSYANTLAMYNVRFILFRAQVHHAVLQKVKSVPAGPT